MGRLIIDGNSCFEIDEKCIKKRDISKRCGLDKYIDSKTTAKKEKDNKKKRGDG